MNKILGSFEIECGKARITDPCYELNTECAGSIENVLNGEWRAEVVKTDEGDWGNRCAVLVAYHEDHPVTHDDYRFKPEFFDVGVDSGQAGIFDIAQFKKDESVSNVTRINKDPASFICENELFYSMCCDRTLSELGAGTIPYGCVSSSGCGDGSYECSSITEDDKVVAIKIDFNLLEDEDDEEENY